MAVTILGASIKNLDIGKDDTGNPTIKGNYELMSSTNKVLATQSFNQGYSSDIKLSMSSKTSALLIDLKNSVQDDLNQTLGLN